ncbi:23S rRNA (uracil(1939)-C(5))-methyltransferase RlmD, partial [Frankia sp. Mgl5]|nr:23S rRNA (uracil(1939)-C(5))-methyltransferase RlmD [Frankia sp. Mgl5]
MKDNLTRIGGFSLEGKGAVQVHPTLGMVDPWRYRNKAQVPIGEQEGALVGGFYAERSHSII